MKQRLLISCIAVVVAVVCVALAYPRYQDYLGVRSDVEVNAGLINQASSRIQELELSFQTVKGETAPRTLKEIAGFLGQFGDGVEIVEMKSFLIDGDGIEILGNVTSVSDTSLCDGYEVTVTSEDLIKFIEYLDTGNLTFHSTDFQFGAKTAILRIRVGGGLNG